MVRIERAIDAGNGGERSEAGIGVPSGDFDPLRDQGTVEPGERNDIAHRAEGDEIEPAEKIGLGAAIAIPAGSAQRTVDRYDEQKGNPDRGQIAVRAGFVE